MRYMHLLVTPIWRGMAGTDISQASAMISSSNSKVNPHIRPMSAVLGTHFTLGTLALRKQECWKTFRCRQSISLKSCAAHKEPHVGHGYLPVLRTNFKAQLKRLLVRIESPTLQLPWGVNSSPSTKIFSATGGANIVNFHSNRRISLFISYF